MWRQPCGGSSHPATLPLLRLRCLRSASGRCAVRGVLNHSAPGCREPGAWLGFQASTTTGCGTEDGTLKPKTGVARGPAPLTSYGALDTFLNLSEPQFLYPQIGIGSVLCTRKGCCADHVPLFMCLSIHLTNLMATLCHILHLVTRATG